MSANFRDRVFITAAELAARQAKGQLVVLAVRSADSVAPRPYAAHDRIPGAIDTDLGTHFAAPSHPRHGSRPLPAIDDLQTHARSWGITADDLVVVYDHDGGLQAARAWWVLKWAGLAEVRLLDGGFPAWQRAGLPVTAEPPMPATPSAITLSPGHMAEFTADQAADFARHGVLLDSRIFPNYCGGPVPQGAPPRGHIPGARSLPAPDNLEPDGQFADPAKLRALYAGVGADGDRPVGVYCGAGVSAAHDIAALASLGIEAALYPGSWSAWSADAGLPVCVGAEPG